MINKKITLKDKAKAKVYDYIDANNVVLMVATKGRQQVYE